MNFLDDFYRNHPLTFIGRDPSKQQLTNLPSSINEARDLILHKSWNSPETKESTLGIKCAQQLYLFATGNYNFASEFSDDPGEEIRFLLKNGRIGEISCGFVNDIDIKQRKDIIKMLASELEMSSIHQITRFCYAHGMYTGHDIEPEELKSMARWIIRNENDGVTFAHFSTMMQQAIDMSVFAQYTTDMGPDIEASSRLDKLAKLGLKLTNKMTKQQASTQEEAGQLFNIASESADRKTIADFQAKVLRAHIEAQLEIEEKIAHHTHDQTNDNNENQEKINESHEEQNDDHQNNKNNEISPNEQNNESINEESVKEIEVEANEIKTTEIEENEENHDEAPENEIINENKENEQNETNQETEENEQNNTENDEHHTENDEHHTENDEHHTENDEHHKESDENHTENEENHKESDENHTENEENHKESDENHTENEENHKESDENHTENEENHKESDENHKESDENHTENEEIGSGNGGEVTFNDEKIQFREEDEGTYRNKENEEADE